MSEEGTDEGLSWRQSYPTSRHKEPTLGRLPGVLSCWHITFVSPAEALRGLSRRLQVGAGEFSHSTYRQWFSSRAARLAHLQGPVADPSWVSSLFT